MKIHKLPIVITIGGLAWITMATTRWFFLYPDHSQLILADSIGVIIVCAGYVYNWMKNIDDAIRDQEKRHNSLVEWWTKHEWNPKNEAKPD